MKQLSKPTRRCLITLMCGITNVPAADLRPLSTDRPDTTESPYTVDAGHYQFEMEIAAWTRDGGELSEFTLGEMNAKYGLSSSIDLQLVLPFYTHIHDGDEGFGDMRIRVKYNLWGNSGGSNAFAIMPYIKLPTARGDVGNGDVEGGLVVPFGFDGPADWSFGVMGEIDLAPGDEGDGYHLLGLLSATASHSVTDNTGVFFEIVGIFTTESADRHEAYFNTGMTWAWSVIQAA